MSIVIVLHRPRDLVNIAAAVRVMKNFELRDLRLVEPHEYDAFRIEGIAHKSGDLLKRAQVYETLDQALADCTFVVGSTARERTAKRNVDRPREAAEELIARAQDGRAALVFGPEDAGLTNAELDRCHRVVTVPTNSAYPSLNLAQAVCVMAYELYQLRGVRPFKSPRRKAPPAGQEQLEQLFSDAEGALRAIDFFKTRQAASVMRTLRGVGTRVPLDAREAALLRAVCIEVVRYLERAGRAGS